MNFGLSRNDILESKEIIPRNINTFSKRLPTYVIIKDVKKRWGRGQVSSHFVGALDVDSLLLIYTRVLFLCQEDVYPIVQYEKLWGDMTAIEGVECSYFVVSRERGQQLKDPAQLDGWSRDGSAAYLNSICSW